MTETPVIEGTTDLTWDETHHLLVPLLRADNHTNILYILGDYLRSGDFAGGMRLDLSIVVGRTALDCTVSASVDRGRDADRRAPASALGAGARGEPLRPLQEPAGQRAGFRPRSACSR